MSWERLPTNYQDLLWSGLKKYTQIENEDGTVSFKDVTKYTNKDDSFIGAREVNKSNEAINHIMASLENGTNLYSGFLDYFNNQKQLFSSNTDTELQRIKSLSKVELDNLSNYIDSEKSHLNSNISNIEREYERRINTYEEQQVALFNLWFNEIRSELTRDVATNLLNKIENLTTKTDGFISKTVQFLENGRKITETMGDRRIETEFLSDREILQKLYVKNNLASQKRITFSEDGLQVQEVIS